MPIAKKCFVCGLRPEKGNGVLHHFPRNEAKRRLWLDAMNVFEKANFVSRGHLICNRHFTIDSYATAEDPQNLNRNAVPSLHPFLKPFSNAGIDEESHSPPPEPLTSSICFNDQCPSTSKDPLISNDARFEAGTSSSTKKSSAAGSRSLLKDPLSTLPTSKEKLLKTIIKKKNGHLRHLKKLCRERGNRIKSLLRRIRACKRRLRLVVVRKSTKCLYLKVDLCSQKIRIKIRKISTATALLYFRNKNKNKK